MKILIVALGESVHSARWLSQITDQEWEVYLFNSADCGYIHPNISNVNVINSFYNPGQNKNKQSKFWGIPIPSRVLSLWARFLLKNIYPKYREKQLEVVIKLLKPDMIHSIEFQHSSYLVNSVRKKFKNNFPKWIVTNWGSDIYFFGRLVRHKDKVKEILGNCDFYSCESERDAKLARDLGFKGKILSTFPNSGGMDLEKINRLSPSGKTSQRKIIMLKGYQGEVGRSLVGLRALERCASFLKGYTVAIYVPKQDIIMAAEIFTQNTGIPTIIIPRETPHEEMLKWHSKARISIGLSMGDGISTSFLEAMAMGSFPIQSWTSTANEWIKDGQSAILVPPEDPDVIKKAIKKALIDDNLVDKAAKINREIVKKRLDVKKLKPKAIEYYQTVLKS